MVADFYEVEERTIERYIAQNEKELSHNGYVLSKGKTLKEIKLQFAHVINVGSKTTQLGLFSFRAFLNIGMLLTESEKAKELRSLILDIVIATINNKTGGGTKFIQYTIKTYSLRYIKKTTNQKNIIMSKSIYQTEKQKAWQEVKDMQGKFYYRKGFDKSYMHVRDSYVCEDGTKMIVVNAIQLLYDSDKLVGVNMVRHAEKALDYMDIHETTKDEFVDAFLTVKEFEKNLVKFL